MRKQPVLLATQASEPQPRRTVRRRAGGTLCSRSGGRASAGTPGQGAQRCGVRSRGTRKQLWDTPILFCAPYPLKNNTRQYSKVTTWYRCLSKHEASPFLERAELDRRTLGAQLPGLRFLPQAGSWETPCWAETHLLTPIQWMISASVSSSQGLRHLCSGSKAPADSGSSQGRAGWSPATQAAKPLANERVIITSWLSWRFSFFCACDLYGSPELVLKACSYLCTPSAKLVVAAGARHHWVLTQVKPPADLGALAGSGQSSDIPSDPALLIPPSVCLSVSLRGEGVVGDSPHFFFRRRLQWNKLESLLHVAWK